MQTHCCMVGWWGIFDAIMMNDFFIEIISDFCVLFFLLLKFWSTNKLYKKLKRSVGIRFWVWWLHMTYDTVFILVYESCDSECQFYHNCRDFCFLLLQMIDATLVWFFKTHWFLISTESFLFKKLFYFYLFMFWFIFNKHFFFMLDHNRQFCCISIWNF